MIGLFIIMGGELDTSMIFSFEAAAESAGVEVPSSSFISLLPTPVLVIVSLTTSMAPTPEMMANSQQWH